MQGTGYSATTFGVCMLIALQKPTLKLTDFMVHMRGYHQSFATWDIFDRDDAVVGDPTIILS
jgi:hypothetical protein